MNNISPVFQIRWHISEVVNACFNFKSAFVSDVIYLLYLENRGKCATHKNIFDDVLGVNGPNIGLIQMKLRWTMFPFFFPVESVPQIMVSIKLSLHVTFHSQHCQK